MWRPTDGRAGERDQVDARIDHELLGHRVVRRGQHVDDAGRDVGLLGDEAADPGGVPRGVGGRLDDHGVAGGEGLAELLQRHLERVVPGDDRADHAGRLLDHLAPAAHAERLADRELALPLEVVDGLGRPEQSVLQRGVELRSVGDGDRAADLGHQLGAEQLLLGHDRVLQLAQALLAERPVGGPVRLVERLASGTDGEVHVLGATVGHLTQHLFGGRVDVVEATAGPTLDELAADQHAHLALHGRGRVFGGGGHVVPLGTAWRCAGLVRGRPTSAQERHTRM